MVNRGFLGRQEQIDLRGTPDLTRYPKSVLLKVAIELNSDVIREKYEEGWTKDRLIREIEKHVKSALGRQGIEGWEPIQDVDVLDIVTDLDRRSEQE